MATRRLEPKLEDGEDGRIGRYETAFLKMRVVAHLLRREAKGEGRRLTARAEKKRPPWGGAGLTTGIAGRGEGEGRIAGVAKGWSGERNEYESN